MDSTHLLTLVIFFLSSTIDLASASQSQKDDASLFVNPLEIPHTLDDFYTAVNRAWLTTTQAPSNSFQEVSDRTAKELYKLVRRTALKVARGTAGLSHVEKLVGNWFLSGTDSRARAKEGLAALGPVFTAMRTTTNRPQLAGMLARKGLDLFFDLTVYVDVEAKGLPHARLYLSPPNNILVPSDLGSDTVMAQCEKSTDLSVVQLCSKVQSVVTDVFEKLGDSPKAAKENAHHVMESVASLAETGPTDLFHLTPAEAAKTIPRFDIAAYFKALGVEPKEIILFHSAWFPVFGRWIGSVSAERLSAFLRWRVLLATYQYLEDDISKMFVRMSEGEGEWLIRQKRVFATMNADPVIGMALGQLFSNKTLPAETYNLMERFIEMMHHTFRLRIQSLGWMQPSTKAEALLKINAFRFFIGAPQADLFSGLVVSRKSYIGNALRAMEYKRLRDLESIDLPESQRSPNYWSALPQEVNAFYHPTRNSIYITAAILQPPFFHAKAVDEINFGAIGSIIGHEMSHGFDNIGRQYDHNGVRRDWWSTDDDRDFDRISRALRYQFDNYSYFNQRVNGALTLGENIADLGGVAIAHDAWRRTTLAGGLPLATDVSKKSIPHAWRPYSRSQRFFLSLARMWRRADTEAHAIANLALDEHAPNIFRCNGPASNLDPFYHAFNLHRGHKMYREPSDRVIIW